MHRIVRYVALLAFLFSILLFIDAWFASSRSILLEVKSRGLTIAFVGRQDTWRFSDAVLCHALESPNRQAQRGPGPCDLRRYHPARTGPITLNWQPGAEAQIEVIPDTGISIRFITALGSIPANSQLTVKADTVDRSGALSFSGKLTAGAIMSSGQTGHLLSGRYEMRESGYLLQTISRRSTSVVSSGNFTLGDEIRLLRADESPATSHGHLSTQNFAADNLIDLVAISEFGDLFISIVRFRLDEPVALRPDWIDRTLSNPVILALTVLLALTTNMVFVWRS